MKVLNRFSSAGAVLVGIGIFFSRIAGLLREKIFAYYFGSSAAGDVFRAALRIPNFLQNLLGEGVLSGSFIPVYARLLAEGKSKEARDLAGSVLAVLSALTLLVVSLGVLLSPVLIDLIAPGFDGERRELCIHLVQILFPGLGFLVLSAFCLGVLNSHKKFFLSYSAPVLWNLAIIASLLLWGSHTEQNQLAVIAGYGVVAGCILQLLVQVPTVMKFLGGIPFHFNKAMFRKGSYLRQVIQSFLPIVTGRGVVQISAYLDTMMASYLPIGALSCLGYAQTLYLLPVSLFGMSISAAELPAMSQTVGSHDEIAAIIRKRVIAACRKIAFFIIPTSAAFVFLGPFILKLLYQGGAFNEETKRMVWFVLIGSTIGLLSTTQGRVFASSFYALRDAKTPLKIAIIRVILSAALGATLAFLGPKLLNVDMSYGTIGLTAGFGISGWIEWLLLKKKLEARIGSVSIPTFFLLKLWVAAFVPAIAGWWLLQFHPELSQSFLRSILVLGVFGLVFLGLATLLKIEEIKELISRVRG